MKRYKKTAAIIGILFIALMGVHVIGSGFRKMNHVYISDYEVSEDGTQMTIYVGVPTSIGYTRKTSTTYKPDGTLCLDVYAAFGGINGSIGARSEFVIPLKDETYVIAIYRSKDYYEPVIRKSENGEWQLLMRKD